MTQWMGTVNAGDAVDAVYGVDDSFECSGYSEWTLCNAVQCNSGDAVDAVY